MNDVDHRRRFHSSAGLRAAGGRGREGLCCRRRRWTCAWCARRRGRTFATASSSGISMPRTCSGRWPSHRRWVSGISKCRWPRPCRWGLGGNRDHGVAARVGLDGVRRRDVVGKPRVRSVKRFAMSCAHGNARTSSRSPSRWSIRSPHTTMSCAIGSLRRGLIRIGMCGWS